MVISTSRIEKNGWVSTGVLYGIPMEGLVEELKELLSLTSV
jgi:hypothetical protein